MAAPKPPPSSLRYSANIQRSIAATMKQAAQPNGAEIAKLEMFVSEVLFKTIQNSDYSVKKSIFYYDPTVLRKFPYNSTFGWTTWTSWDQAAADATDRAYDYVVSSGSRYYHLLLHLFIYFLGWCS
jgi:hypothetical protein